MVSINKKNQLVINKTGFATGSSALYFPKYINEGEKRMLLTFIVTASHLLVENHLMLQLLIYW